MHHVKPENVAGQKGLFQDERWGRERDRSYLRVEDQEDAARTVGEKNDVKEQEKEKKAVVLLAHRLRGASATTGNGTPSMAMGESS